MNIFALHLSQINEMLQNVQKVAQSKLFSVIFLPFQEHQLFESELLSAFFPFTPPYHLATALPVK